MADRTILACARLERSLRHSPQMRVGRGVCGVLWCLLGCGVVLM